MKRMVLVGTILAALVSQASSLCDDPLSFSLVCHKMKNLRSHIMMLESQRDLMQINYSYIQTVSGSLSKTAQDLINQLPIDFEDHRGSLQNVVAQSSAVSQLAQQLDPQVFNTANLLRQNCVACHNSSDPFSGVKWDEAFKMDWAKIVQKCDQPGRNPFVCKNMYGLITNYGYITTAYLNKIEDHKMIETSAKEIARISGTLVDQNFMHDRMSNIQDVRLRAQEVQMLAAQQDPQSLEKANAIVETCMGCHSSALVQVKSALKVGIWN